MERVFEPSDMRSRVIRTNILIGIGDIHGHYTALESLLDALHGKYDIFLDRENLKLNDNIEMELTGDFIDRGSQNRKVVETAIRLKENNENVHELFGNHELIALSSIDAARRSATLRDYIIKQHKRYCLNRLFVVL